MAKRIAGFVNMIRSGFQATSNDAAAKLLAFSRKELGLLFVAGPSATYCNFASEVSGRVKNIMIRHGNESQKSNHIGQW